MKIEFKTPDFKKTLSKFENMPSTVRESIDNELDRSGKKIQTEQELLIPVGMTADLKRGQRSSVYKYKNKSSLRIWNTENYAIYVEFGTGPKGVGTATEIPEGIAINYRNEGWVYYNEQLQKFFYTEGMPARQFFYPPIYANLSKVDSMLRSAFARGLNK